MGEGKGESAALTDEERIDWLRLIRSENAGPRSFRSLLRYCGSARRALAQLPELAQRVGAGMVRICSRAEAERELAAARALGVRLICVRERIIRDGLPRSTTRRGSSRCAAISRRSRGPWWQCSARATPRRPAPKSPRSSRDLGAAGFVVVSGLAHGVDAAAHRASLASGTVAVLAGGHDQIYPAEHAPLLEDIIEQGAAISEMPLGWEPRARDFPSAATG